MTEVSNRLRTPLLAALISGSCAPAISSVPTAQPACVVVDEWSHPRITIATAAADPVLRSEQLYPDIAAAQIFETLVHTDCTGAAVGSLAADWTPRALSPTDGTGASSAEWQFSLRQDATFSDGVALTAAAVVAAWGARDTGTLESVTAVGDHDLRVALRAPATATYFAQRSHVVTRSDGGLLGTGPYAAEAVARTGNARPAGQPLRLVLRSADVPAASRMMGSMSPDTIDVRVHRDLRTALDAQVDAVVTGDPAVLAYARAIGDYEFVPLPWTRTWVLATSPLLTAALPARSEFDDPAATFSTDVMGTDVRSAARPFWWRSCGTGTTAAPRGETDGRVLYAQDDAVARAIAERIAALAHDRAPQWLRDVMTRPDRPVRAIGVSAADLIIALRSGSPLAIVTALPRTDHGGCGVANGAAEALFTRWHVTALIDARDYLVHRPGIGRVHVDGDGMIRFGVR